MNDSIINTTGILSSIQRSFLEKSKDPGSLNPDSRELFTISKTILEPSKDVEEPDHVKAMKIARRIARGENVSSKERFYLQKYFPILLEEAELAKKEGERVKTELQNAKSRSEQQDILIRENNFIAQTSKVNQDFADLIAEAVEKACEEVRITSGQKNLYPYMNEDFDSLKENYDSPYAVCTVENDPVFDKKS